MKAGPIREGLKYLCVGTILIWTLFPIYWLVTASVKSEIVLYGTPPAWWFRPVLESYVRVLFNIPFPSYFLNSLIVAGATTVGSVILGSLAAYGFSRFTFWWSEGLRFFILLTRMIPRVALVMPYFLMMLSLGLLDTHAGLILAYISFALPFSIWLMIGFFDEVPVELEDAAMVDGCSRLMALLRVTLPLAAPGLVVAAIFAFLVSWNEFLFALILSGIRSKTLPVVIAGFNTDIGPLYSDMSAAATLVMIPNIVMTVLIQKHVVRGLTFGAVRG
ncbi:MAG: carbohydrate ABC transporter permease [candidate division NC10 bacterium]|nr:carbohydrate ABC transporter permease [candidate division NC10 bacterium]